MKISKKGRTIFMFLFSFLSFFSCIDKESKEERIITSFTKPYFSINHGLYENESFDVSISRDDYMCDIRYTLDGSEPTENSLLYEEPLHISSTTILRAVECYKGEIVTPISTASYIFIDSVLKQSNTPKGYPENWGRYSKIDGISIADYEMNPDMVASLRPKLIEGLKSLPILSIVTDKDNIFSHENDPEKGGIYIYTGSPFVDGTGRGWTRPVNVELLGGTQDFDLNTTCGIRLHGGAGRAAEYNPKHSFRLVFKKQYGPKSLEYPLFGIGGPRVFKQLVLRCHFDHSWQHLYEAYREKAQYTRDIWVREMQKKMGHPSVNALYVHLFINGLYWGLYNISERVDEQFVKNHLNSGDADVIENEEYGGLHMEASEGTLDGWKKLVSASLRLPQEDAYKEIMELLDIDNFIDYMILNQYVGNIDWDLHNWFSVRSKESTDKRFKLICWDSESVLINNDDNVVNINYGDTVPSGLFHNLLKYDIFKKKYKDRAEELLAIDGLLGYESVVHVWDSLYYTISAAIYDEAARWGDYRYKVHPYLEQGQQYTVDEHYMNERNRLLYDYFPNRNKYVLKTINEFVNSFSR